MKLLPASVSSMVAVTRTGVSSVTGRDLDVTGRGTLTAKHGQGHAVARGGVAGTVGGNGTDLLLPHAGDVLCESLHLDGVLPVLAALDVRIQVDSVQRHADLGDS